MELKESDENLMQRYQAGEEAAFSELYRRYRGRLYGYLLHQNVSKEMAEEVYQSIWMKLHRLRFRYKAQFKFSAWLFTIARSLLIDILRSEKKFQKSFSVEEVFLNNTESEEKGPSLEMALAWDQLNEGDQKTLQWRYLEAASFEEIGQRLGLNPINVRKRVSRALKRLKEKTLQKS